MSYQKCPVCNGVGTVSGGYFTRVGDCSQWTSSSVTECCRICNGKGIIDEVMGLPPNILDEYLDDEVESRLSYEV